MGVYKVPEMLVMSVLDSVEADKVSLKVAESYSVLGNELAEIAAETTGYPGQIMYNNDPNNFRFECFIPIKKLPVLQPKRSHILTLESANMLLYNYYGPYNELYLGYDKIRTYMRENKWEQNGVTREYYITDPTVEQNQSKWLTRVMVPVTKADTSKVKN